ncbi:MAG: Rrf2 family transcriptional regulator [Acidimicrobiia bacterium]
MHLVLQKRTDLALKALIELQGAGGRVTGPDLARAVGTSSNYLPQVLNPMLKAGWVSSDRGPSGGYTLTIPLAELSLLDLIETYEGSLTVGGTCLLRGGPCPSDDRCPFHTAWSNVTRAMTAELGARSVIESVEPRELTT